jgi:integral membrane protein
LTGQGATDEGHEEVTEPRAIAIRRSLGRYRFMAYVVGTGLVILVFIGIPLQYGAGLPQLAEIVGPIHGAMYIVYLAAAVDLTRRANLRTRQLAAIVLAGFVPFVAFVVERRVTMTITSGLPSSDTSIG